MSELKIGDMIEVTVDSGSILSYLKSYHPSEETYIGRITSEGSDIWENSLIIIPIELQSNKNFFPKLRVISKKYIKNIVKINDDFSKDKMDIEDINLTPKVRTWNVTGSKGDIYNVIKHTSGKITCNCFAGLMNRHCKHVKSVEAILSKEE